MVRFMARILKITIKESVEFLEKPLKNTRTAASKRTNTSIMVVKNRASTAASRISESFGERQIYDNQVVTKVSTGWIVGIIVGKKSPRTRTTLDR